jgi:hypothetical protein
MKRLVLLAVAVAASLAVAAPGLADPPAGVMPTCADIIGGSASFSGTAVTASIRTLAATCTNANYTVLVVTYNAAGHINGGGLQTQPGNGTRPIILGYNIATEAAPYACVFFVSSIGWRVLDIAPDNGCPLSLDLTPGVVLPGNVLAADSGSPGGGFFK